MSGRVCEQLQPLLRWLMASRWAERSTGALASLLPVAHRLGTEARFGVVMRHQLWLGSHGVGKLRFQHLRNTLVILLPRALQERLIGRILDEGVLEDVAAARRQTALVDQFSLHEPRQPLLQRRLIHRRDGVEQVVAKLPAQDRTELRPFSGRREPVEPGHERVVQRGGNDQRGQRAVSA